MNFLLTKRLKYFITSMETRCINLAAEQLYITRTPLIRILNELEDNFQGKLFHKKYNNLEPTELAVIIYDKVKPVYDKLYSIERELIETSVSPAFELLFDISVPYIIFHFMKRKFQQKKLPVFCRRVSVSGHDIITLQNKTDCGLFSFRNIQVPGDISFHFLGEQSLCILCSENTECSDLNNIDEINNVKILIRKDEFSHEIKDFIASMIKDFSPYIEIKETELDMSLLMLFVSSGESAIILPEYISSYFSPPKTKRLIVPGTKMTTGLYVSKRYKNKIFIDEIVAVLDSYK